PSLHSTLALHDSLPIFVFYKLHPNFLTTGMQNDQIFPLFIGQQVPVGFAGLIIAGIFSASMSSLDSSMHSMATVITVDFYERFRSEEHTSELQSRFEIV